MTKRIENVTGSVIEETKRNMKIVNVTAWARELEDKEKPRYAKEDKIIIAWCLATDGSILISKITHKGKTYLQPRLNFGNTNFALLETFKNVVKLGRITKTTFKQEKKPLGLWQLAWLRAVQYVLKEILEYLPAKRKQAELVLEFITSRFNRGIKTKRTLPYSKREQQIYEEVRKLNKEGAQ